MEMINARVLVNRGGVVCRSLMQLSLKQQDLDDGDFGFTTDPSHIKAIELIDSIK